MPKKVPVENLPKRAPAPEAPCSECIKIGKDDRHYTYDKELKQWFVLEADDPKIES